MGEWINVTTFLYGKTLKQSMIDLKKGNPMEAEEFKKIYNHILDKRTVILKKAQFKVEDVFGNKKGKDSISPVKVTKLDNFLPKIMKIKILV